MTSLLTTPFSGEMGWELMAWIPYLRIIAPQYDKVIIGCDPRMDYFYEDFAHEIYHRKNPNKGDRWLDHGKVTKVHSQRLERYKNLYPDLKVIAPTEQNCTAWKKREWKAYGTVREECKYDIVLHARNLWRYCHGYRNWPLIRWGELVDYHSKYKMCCIGTKKDAYKVPGVEDKRDIPVEELCDILASSRLTIGPSSGPMHLAHLCRCPIIVWTDNKVVKCFYGKKKKRTNRYRYEKLWRAFPDVHVGVIDGRSWRVKVKSVTQAITNFFRYTEQGLVVPRRSKSCE